MNDISNLLKMYRWLKDLFPICRSITRDGQVETLRYLKRINKNLKIINFRTNKKVFDWKIPKVWNIEDAYIESLKTKKKYAHFKKNNLHVVNYSEPVNKILKTSELLKKIHTHKNPNYIPYRTTYYNKNWGFCMSKKELSKLKEKTYRAVIKSNFSVGYMKLGEIIHEGKSKKEIFFSTYICHPSMANNELSGPVVLSKISKYLMKLKNRKYTYRLVFLPETIGSIAYLSKNYKKMKKNIIAGYNLSCVGDNRNFSLIKSKFENSISNNSLKAELNNKKNFKIYEFKDHASDEGHYNSPGIDIPVAGFCRTKYKSYKEYHSSADNLNIVSESSLEGSFQVFKNIIDVYETSLFPKTKILCEPFFSKRGMYPKISGKILDQYFIDRKNIFKYSDGKFNTFEIALKLNLNLKYVLEHLKILIKYRIIE